jgi:ABC-type enterochelin transport system substrate-binding protein
MKQNPAEKARAHSETGEKGLMNEKSLHIAEVFGQLDDKAQEYMENLTASLAEIHEKSPEKQNNEE